MLNELTNYNFDKLKNYLDYHQNIKNIALQFDLATSILI